LIYVYLNENTNQLKYRGRFYRVFINYIQSISARHGDAGNAVASPTLSGEKCSKFFFWAKIFKIWAKYAATFSCK